VAMSTISLRLNDKDDAIIRKYAEIHNMDLSSFIRHAVLEKIEDNKVVITVIEIGHPRDIQVTKYISLFTF
jgi:uncharacterized protein (DUF1778 family)